MGFLFDKDTHRSTLPVRTISCPRRRNMLCMKVVYGKFSCTAGCAACRPADAPPRCLPGHCPPVLRPCRSTTRRSAACRSCGPAGAQLATPPTLRPLPAGALPAGLATLPKHNSPKRRPPVLRPCRSTACHPADAPPRCLPGHCLPVLRPCGGTTRRSAVRRSCGPPEHCLPERCLPKYRQLTSAARPKFRLPVLRLCRSTARRSAARRPRYAKKRSSSSRAAMSDSAMRRLSFDLSV